MTAPLQAQLYASGVVHAEQLDIATVRTQVGAGFLEGFEDTGLNIDWMQPVQ